MIKLLLLVAIVVLITMACARRFTDSRGRISDKPAVSVSYSNVGADEFQTVIATEQMQLLDVRTREEYDEGHIAGAVLVDVNDSDFVEKAVSVLDKQRPVAVYCRSGRRSARAASLLTEQGYVVTNLDGGVIEWQGAGKTLIR